MTVRGVGIGLGHREIPGRPNLLRVVAGDPVPGALGRDRVLEVEANIDDMSPQRFELLIERALAAGALDVAILPATMKKNRPGWVLRLLCPEERLEIVSSAVFSVSTAIGLRFHACDRMKLDRACADARDAVRARPGEGGDAAGRVGPPGAGVRRREADRSVGGRPRSTRWRSRWRRRGEGKGRVRLHGVRDLLSQVGGEVPGVRGVEHAGRGGRRLRLAAAARRHARLPRLAPGAPHRGRGDRLVADVVRHRRVRPRDGGRRGPRLGDAPGRRPGDREVHHPPPGGAGPRPAREAGPVRLRARSRRRR